MTDQAVDARSTARAALTILDGPSGTLSASWSLFIDHLEQVIGLPARAPVAVQDGPGRPDAVLRVAASAPAPVVVLPPQGIAHRGDGKISSVTLASDASPAVARAVSVLCQRFCDAGIRTTLLLVLTPSVVPPIWEGDGHHAEAWRVELERRHGQPDSIEIVGGPADVRIGAALGRTDLVVLLWRRVAGFGRAQVVRAVLEQASGPCLLVPLRWTGSLRRAWRHAGPAGTGH